MAVAICNIPIKVDTDNITVGAVEKPSHTNIAPDVQQNTEKSDGESKRRGRPKKG